MISQQAKIMIFVTKAGTLRSRIIPACGEPLFEITLGGNEWMAGKGSEYHPVILKKATALVPCNSYSFAANPSKPCTIQVRGLCC